MTHGCDAALGACPHAAKALRALRSGAAHRNVPRLVLVATAERYFVLVRREDGES